MCFPTSSNTNPSVSLSSPWRDGLGKGKGEGEGRNILLLQKKKSLNYCLRRKFVINLDSPTRRRAVGMAEPRPDLGGHMRTRRPRLLLKALPLEESQPTPP